MRLVVSHLPCHLFDLPARPSAPGSLASCLFPCFSVLLPLPPPTPQLLARCHAQLYHPPIMTTTTNNPLSHAQATQFFQAPEAIRQRQYEALRAYFLDGSAPPAQVRGQG